MFNNLVIFYLLVKSCFQYKMNESASFIFILTSSPRSIPAIEITKN